MVVTSSTDARCGPPRVLVHELPRPQRLTFYKRSSGTYLSTEYHPASPTSHALPYLPSVHPYYSRSTAAHPNNHGVNLLVHQPRHLPPPQARLPPSPLCPLLLTSPNSYGTLLGSTLFQSFISGVVAYRVLPRPQFSTLQKHTFPVYFTLQTLSPLALLLTYPSGATRLLPSLLSSTPARVTQSPTDRLAAWLLGTMFVTALANMVYVGPQTTRVMVERKHQETRDGKAAYDKGPHSKEMERLNWEFSVLHGVSSVTNLVGLGAMVWYGAVLGAGLSFERVAL